MDRVSKTLFSDTTCNEASPDYLKIKPMRKQRNMGEQGMLYSPYAIMDVFAIGEVVVGSEKNITEKYATKARIYYCEIVPCDIVHV